MTHNRVIILAAAAVISLTACSEKTSGGEASSNDVPADAAATVRHAIADHGPDWASSVDDFASIMPGTVGILVHDVSRPQAADMCSELNGWIGGDYALAVETTHGDDLAVCSRIDASQRSDAAGDESAPPREHKRATEHAETPESTPTPTTAPTTSIDSPAYNENGDTWLSTDLEDIDLPEVRQIQEQLVLRGYSVVVDGSYGPQTAAAVRQFQTDHGITVDGIIGPETFRYLVYVSGN